jgi:cytochrome c oxidase subunit II
VPEGIPVRLNLTSSDVIHSFGVPAFRIKKDVIKNRSAVIWFKATMKGTFIYTCNEMCGESHGHMIGYLRVVSEEEYNKYLKAIAGPLDPWDLGRKTYEGSCSTCHSIDGSTKVGPTWDKLFGKTDYEMSDGTTVTVDEDYIRQSILEPAAKKAKKFANGNMPPMSNLTPEQIEGLIQFIKSPNKKPEN